MSQNDKKQIFFEFFFSQKTLLWADRMQFCQPSWFFRGNAENFCSISDADKTERFRNDTFLKKCSFQRLFFRSRRLQLWQTKRKVYDKKCQLYSLKVQKSRVLKKQFLRKTFFSIKVFFRANRNQYWLPSRKSFVKSQKICGSIFDTVKKNSKFSTFIHQMFLWTRETEVLNTPPIFSNWKSEVYICQVSKSKKKLKVFQKKAVKMVVWIVKMKFWHNSGKKNEERPFILAPSPELRKNRIFPKIFFFSKKRSSGEKRIKDCSFDNPANFFVEMPNVFVQSPRLTIQKETEMVFFEKM